MGIPGRTWLPIAWFLVAGCHPAPAVGDPQPVAPPCALPPSPPPVSDAQGAAQDASTPEARGAPMVTCQPACNATAGEQCCNEATGAWFEPVCKPPPCHVRELCAPDGTCSPGYHCWWGRTGGYRVGECHFSPPPPVLEDCEECRPRPTCDAPGDCGPRLHCCLSAMALRSGMPATECRNGCDQAQLFVVCGDLADCPDAAYRRAVRCAVDPDISPSHKVCIYP